MNETLRHDYVVNSQNPSESQLAKEDATLSSPAVAPSLSHKTLQGQVGKHPVAGVWGNSQSR